MPSGGSQPPVACQQRCVERLGKRDVGSIIGRQIVPQIPDAGQKEIVRIALQGKVCQIGEGQTAALRPDFAVRSVASDDLGNFDIEQMRRVKRLTRGEQPILHGFRRRCAEQGFK